MKDMNNQNSNHAHEKTYLRGEKLLERLDRNKKNIMKDLKSKEEKKGGRCWRQELK